MIWRLRISPCKGAFLVREGKQNNRRLARLDRFVVTENWDHHFGGVVQCVLPRPISDHSLILLEGEGTFARGPIPFHFENMWLKAEGFEELVNSWWQRLSFSGSSSYILIEKIKALKPLIKTWNKEVFGKVEEKKKAALIKVKYWDEIESQRPLSLAELEERVSATTDFKK